MVWKNSGENAWHLAGPRHRNLIVLGIVVCVWAPTTQAWVLRHAGRRPTALSAVLIGIMFLASLVFMGRVSEFLYFQF